MPAFVDGRLLIQPQAVSVVTEETTIGDQPVTQNIVAVIGTSTGGTPRTWTRTFSYAQAKQTFRSGNVIELLRRVYGPAQGANGAYQVLTYRLDNAARASGALTDGDGNAVIDLLSRDYGLHTNQTRVKIEAGTTHGYKATVQGPDSSATLLKDNISRQQLRVAYTGSGTAATLSVSATALTTTVTDGAAGDSATLAFASYATIQSIADALAGTGSYSVTVVGAATDPSDNLDTVDSADSTSAITISSNTQALLDWLNTDTPYITATRVTGNAVAPMTAFIALIGGANGGAVSAADYQTALTALQAEHATILVVESDDSAVHAMVDAHCHLMSAVGANRERIAIVGGALSDTHAQVLQRAASLSSFRTALVYPGVIDTDELGVRREFGPPYTAAAVAGLMAGLTPGTPGTRRPVRCIGPTTRITPHAINDLLLGGVLPVEAHPREGARIVQSITSYNQGQTGSANIMRVELSSRLAADQLIQRVRTRLDDVLVGAASGPLFREQARSIAESELKLAQTDGLIVGDREQPAYADLSATVRGQVVEISFKASVVAPGNYVVIRASLSTYSAG